MAIKYSSCLCFELAGHIFPMLMILRQVTFDVALYTTLNISGVGSEDEVVNKEPVRKFLNGTE